MATDQMELVSNQALPNAIESETTPALAPPTMKHPIRSFDIFDTLFARRCLEPLRIFEQMEQRLELKGFSQMRQAAEAALLHGDFTLDDIYMELARIIGMNDAQREAVKWLEIETELANVIPIADQIAMVNDGDILVSDMYLSEATVRRLLEHVGFNRHVGIYISSHGKSSGEVWPLLKKNFMLAAHCGDNPVSDVANPRRHGIITRHLTAASPLPTEAWLINIGLRDLALLCREVRLMTGSTNHLTRQLIDLQCAYNFPMLLLGCVPLLRLVRERRFRRVLFSSRDGELWFHLFKMITAKLGLECEVEYFYSSRLARMRSSRDYISYASEKLGVGSRKPEVLLVDLCGTGWSIAKLAEQLGHTPQPTFMFQHVRACGSHETALPIADLCELHSVVGLEEDGISNPHLEMLNAAPYGSVVDVQKLGAGFVPVMDLDTRSEELIAYVREQHKVFDALVKATEKAFSPRWFEIDDKPAKQAAALLAREISKSPVLPATYWASHLEEHRSIVERIGHTDIYGN